MLYYNLQRFGGRGASSGISRGTKNNPNGNAYGTQYNTIDVEGAGNIKFVEKTPENTESLMETMTKGRVYVLVNHNGPKEIIYFGNDGKRTKVIDLDHPHKKIQPHTHHGYEHIENEKSKKGASNLTTEEKAMVERVKKLWYNHINRV